MFATGEGGEALAETQLTNAPLVVVLLPAAPSIHPSIHPSLSTSSGCCYWTPRRFVCRRACCGFET